jgi:hypothetical protein
MGGFVVMYEGTTPGRGGEPLVGGGLLLPNTGGNTLLTIVAVTSIAVGAAILVSTLVRAIAAKTAKA